MARFRFRLQTLLRQREIAEQTHRRAVADLERQRLELEGRIRRHQEAISSGKQDLRDQLVGRLDGSQLRGQAAMAMRAMRDAQQLVLELAGLHRRIETAREGLREASARRRALELLRDRQYARWQEQITRREDAMIDDLVAARASREQQA